MARDLQTGSTGVAVEAVPESEVSCLSLELQAWLLQWAVALVLGLEILACPGSLGSLEDLSREIGTAMEERSLASMLQTWATAVAVEAVPEGLVRCI